MSQDLEGFEDEFDNENMSNDEIDLREILNSILRNKELFTICTFSSVLISIVFAYSTKKTWEGGFQIVLDSTPQNSLQAVAANSGLSMISGVNSKIGGKKLKTEVEILKSPSVLLNIYNFVKDNNALNSSKTKRFKKWRKDSLNVQLQKDTTVLNLSYRDNNKDLILPVLNKISKAYQDYSGKKRAREIELSLNFLDDQIKKYSNKADISEKKADDFGSLNQISVITNSSPNFGSQSINNILQYNPIYTDIEQKRDSTLRKLRLNNEYLKYVKAMDLDSDLIIFADNLIRKDKGFQLPSKSQISLIDLKLSKLRLIYNDNDKEITKLLEQRNSLKELLRKEITGMLTQQKNSLEATLKTTNRKDGIISQYKRLISEAQKDQATLSGLSIQYRNALLERSRSRDPWQLITEPTLLPYPIAPAKKRYVALGLFTGILLGTLSTNLKDKKSKIIYSLSVIKRIYKSTLITELNLNNNDSWKEYIELLINGPLFLNQIDIGLIFADGIEDVYSKEIINFLNSNCKKKKLNVITNFKDIKDNSKLLIITRLGFTTINKLDDINKKLKLKNISSSGLIVINNE